MGDSSQSITLLFSFDLEVQELLILQLLLLSRQNAINTSEHGSVQFETLTEVFEGGLEEPKVVSSRVYGLAHIAHEVLEERANNHIQDLDDLDIDQRAKGGRLVELLEINTACVILFSSSDVQFLQCLTSVLPIVDNRVEVVSDVVHEE